MMNAEDVSSEIGMELSKEENVSSRWVSPDKADDSHNILWVSVARDGVILAEVGTDNPKIQKASRRLLKKQPKTGWDFYTYAIESQRRLVQAVKVRSNARCVYLVGFSNIAYIFMLFIHRYALANTLIITNIIVPCLRKGPSHARKPRQAARTRE